jgi:hypothetical protein
VRFHLCNAAHLERLDKVGHALPQVSDLLKSADYGHLRRIIERVFESKSLPVHLPHTGLVVPASQLIEDYRNAFVRADLTALLNCFAFPLQVASVVGDEVSVSVADSQDWPEVLGGLLELYRHLGVADAAMVAVEISQPLDPVAVVRVHWDLQRADGTSVYDFTAVYTLVRADGSRKIIAIAHDELSKIRAARLKLKMR